MHSKKEYERKIKKLEGEVKKWGEKNSILKKELKEKGKETKYYKRRSHELQKSRDEWKEKHKVKQQKIKYLKVKTGRMEKIKGHHYPKLLVILCVLLRIKAACSYRGIIRVLKIIQFWFQLEIQQLPCENSIQNWVSKVGLYTLKKEDKGLQNSQVSLIIDESIRMGQEKQLLVLCLPWKKDKQGALGFEDVQVLHIEGSTSWTGEKISRTVDKLIETHGFEVKNILSDEDSKLKKASRLSEIAHLPDISHAVATCLRKAFEKEPAYKEFTTLVASYQSKGVNQDISYLCPPKQRSKARFMNQQGIVNWAAIMLNRFGSLEGKANSFFSQLPDKKPVVNALTTCLGMAKKISLPFKEKGLSSKTLQQAKQITAAKAKEQGFVGQFLTHINSYLVQYQELVNQMGNYAIHASSEIIESMFGKYKSKAHNHPLTGLTKLNLELPLYCMKYEELAQQVPIALENISMNYLEQWIEKNSSDNQMVKRIRFFKK